MLILVGTWFIYLRKYFSKAVCLNAVFTIKCLFTVVSVVPYVK
jgi:hypothetical protein